MLQKEFFERTGGGFQVACERYYKRIAIVEADSLAVLRVIYPVKEEE